MEKDIFLESLHKLSFIVTAFTAFTTTIPPNVKKS